MARVVCGFHGRLNFGFAFLFLYDDVAPVITKAAESDTVR